MRGKLKMKFLFPCLLQCLFLFYLPGIASSGVTPHTFPHKQSYQDSTKTSLLPRLLPRHSSNTFSNVTADEICHSDGFQPTMENWWLSGATEWLKAYTLANHENEDYKELGLIDSLAFKYLKKTNFKCSIDTAPRCAVECQEVVQKVPDIEEAKIIYFTLRSAQNIAEVTKIVHETLVAAQINMAEIVPIMSKTFFWTEGFDNHMWAVIFTHTIDTLASLFGMFFPMMKGLMAINKNLERIAQLAAAAVAEARASMDELVILQATAEGGLYAGELEGAKAKLTRETKKSESMDSMVKLAKLGFTDIILGQIGSGIGRAFGTSNRHMNFHGRHPGNERTRESNELNLEGFIRSSCMRARDSLKAGAETLFSGAMLQPDGTSAFSMFTVGGNFLPDSTGDATTWRDSGIERNITRGLMLKTLNVAINSQSVYITCSKDYRQTATTWKPSVEDKALAPTCKKDNSGPQEFKACIDGYCCYLYKWNDRGWAPSWRNEKIFGSNVIDEEPWNVEVTDIIKSSVGSYTNGLRDKAPSAGLATGIFNSLGNDHAVESLWDAATPGIFTIPVCFSTYNWATVIDGYRFPQNGLFDTQPRNSIKNLPCNCGPWGKDTEKVWKEIGIWDTDVKHRKYFGDYTAGKCGYQIYDKIKDPVERYVAYCRVNVHTTLNFRIRHEGKHWQCDIIIAIIEQFKYPSVHEMDPEVYHAIYCKVAFMGSSRKDCKGYEEPLGVILNRMGKNPPRVEIEGEANGNEAQATLAIEGIESN